VGAQTAVAAVEQIVIPDHIGVGIHGMYARVRDYATAVHGRYVHMLCDDDVLASPTVVAEVAAFAEAHDNPPVILVRAQKGHSVWPGQFHWPPVCGHIDLGCVITRADVWQQHVTDYGQRYEGDFDFMAALAQAGYPAAYCDLLFLRGGVSHGQAEVAA
jgi:hypothetical protein